MYFGETHCTYFYIMMEFWVQCTGFLILVNSPSFCTSELRLIKKSQEHTLVNYYEKLGV